VVDLRSQNVDPGDLKLPPQPLQWIGVGGVVSTGFFVLDLLASVLTIVSAFILGVTVAGLRLAAGLVSSLFN
jgi:hypothetical protein